MEKKKARFKLRYVVLIFFVVSVVLAIYGNTSIRIGKFPYTEATSQISDENSSDSGAISETYSYVDSKGNPVYRVNKLSDFGSFTIWTETKWLKDKHSGQISDVGIIENIQLSISTGLLPDVYVKEHEISDPEQFTWGSRKIYNFFIYLFHEKSPIKFFGDDSAILNFRLWRMLLFLNIFIIIGALFVRRQLAFMPSKVQIGFEMFYTFFDNLVIDSLGEANRRFVPYFMTIFLFIWMSNWSSLLPIPGITEPTSNLNCTLGMGIMGVLLVHYFSIRKKGIVNWGKGLCDPFVAMLPMNIVGELSKIVSVSFRLFGNIFGGAIITIVISALCMTIMIPVGLNMFFTMFSGTIQAFVFTMLTMSYLSLEIGEA